ncbi:hypothetical protein BN1723_019994, partial [Verticillium longisporum]
ARAAESATQGSQRRGRVWHGGRREIQRQLSHGSGCHCSSRLGLPLQGARGRSGLGCRAAQA